MMIHNPRPVRLALATALSVSLLTAVSCTSDKKKEADAKPAKSTAAPATSANVGGARVSVKPGEAGGVIEETTTASAIVRKVDLDSRTVTLERSDGETATFTAPPEVQNLPQLKAGDRVKATVVTRLMVFVNKAAAPGETYTSVSATAPKGAKPGALVAETFEMVGTVTLIDAPARRAEITFADGQTKTVDVRDDVDLSRYKVGDKVVIRATQQLNVLVEAP